ncbi:muts domain V-domain-containing protein [Lasiosphaeria miniovina]|uniref:Muts domain V-domain-containing protein n=1 Tax=Lasiosphaeria miniovina TaxID=1954250 RepID=A0AA40BFR9_9PEZI|nr:muts domain V-domain-containing protein [Lasiosphaeria miniovina]KAK0733434.1 muts domain V-domain-containing protein [Lasiosphaeria miniovina]
MLFPRAHSVPRVRIACRGSATRTATPFATLGLLASAGTGTPGPQTRAGAAFLPLAHVRGKKTKTVVTLGELPQGLIVAEPPLPLAAAEAEDSPAYPTVVLQARRNMLKFDNCVLLTRVGGFYELYFEHADEYGPLLNLKVAQKRTSAGPVPMAGFPFFQLDRFLKVLVQDLNRHVAIAEEFPNGPSEKVKSGGLLHDRRVARIVTPGTLIDENFMDPYANNYVMAIHLPEARASGPAPSSTEDGSSSPSHGDSALVGVAWLDLSTGCFYTQPATLSSLGSVLARVSPREVVLDKALEAGPSHSVLSILAEERYLVTYSPQGELQTLSEWAPMLESEIPAQTAEQFTEDEVRAGSLLLHFVKERLRGLSMKLQPPLRFESMQVMGIDKNSMRSLEIKQTIRDNVFRGSLLHAIRRTRVCAIGSPSTSLEVINLRQELVSWFIQEEDLRDSIVILLRRSHDSQRLVQKFAMNRGEPDDLLRLASTVKATEDIVNLLQASIASHKLEEQPPPSSSSPSPTKPSQQADCLSTMIGRISLDQPLQLAQRIKDAIDEEGLVQQHQIEDSEAGEMIALAQEIVKTEGTDADGLLLPKGAATSSAAAAAKSGKKRSAAATTSLRDHYGEDNEVWIMKPNASPGLARLHKELAALSQDRAELTETLRARLNAASLTLRWTPGLGHICHVKGKDVAAAATTTTLSASRSTRSFHQPEWTALGERLDKVRFQMRAAEQRVFAALREQVVLSLVKLRRNAAVLDELDIATSFARLAIEKGLTRPVLKDNTNTTNTNNTTTQQTIIMGGRHPTVEGGLAEQGRTFQRNDCLVGAPGHGRAWLITGPNMAGKSTFLRQNALITVLAQIGCYVPADYAELSVVDAIFSRVGSADNLFQDQSTFMVEMLETAAILRQATPRSFVIMDEVGRGTTPEDGTAVAFAALHHLVHVNRCRVLFATHFHKIADLVTERGMRLEDGGTAGSVETYCTDVKEDEHSGFVYVHRLRKGVNRQSHALKVARLAGLPGPAIRIAQQLLGDLPVGTLRDYETHKPAAIVS